METNQVSIYKQWFTTCASEPNKEFHFNNIIVCLKEDIASGVVTASEREELAEFYRGLVR